MQAKYLGAVFTALLFGTSAIYAQQTSTTCTCPGTAGQGSVTQTTTAPSGAQEQTTTQATTPSTATQAQTTAPEQATTTEQVQTPSGTQAVKTSEATGTVTKVKAGKEIDVKSADGHTTKFKLNEKNETVTGAENLAVGQNVTVTETMQNGRKTVSITPSAAGATPTATGGGTSY